MGERVAIWGLCLFVSSGVAAGDTIFLGIQGTTLYRVSGGVTETFTLGADLTSLAVAPDGTIWGAALTDTDGDTLRELYNLSDPLGPAPSVLLQGDFLEENTPALTFIGGTLYGFQKTPGAPVSETRLVTIDVTNQTQSHVGQTGAVGVGANGAAYDPAEQKLYSVYGGPPGELYDINYSLAGGASDPTGTLVGLLGIPFINGGAEFFDGTLYALIQRVDTDELVLGTVNPTTGAFTQTRVVDTQAPEPVALAVIPEPTMVGLLGVLGLVILRHRR